MSESPTSMSPSPASLSQPPSPWSYPLKVAIVGGGLGGLSCALGLRRAGHHVTVYERERSGIELGSGIGICSNGTKFLDNWGLDFCEAYAMVCNSLVVHEWTSGKVLAKAPFGDYKAKFGSNYYMTHRKDLHDALMEEILKEEDEKHQGPKCVYVKDHTLLLVRPETGECTFANGLTIQADLVVGADGIHSQTRSEIGIIPKATQSSSCCYRAIIPFSKLSSLGLGSLFAESGLAYWGGMGINKVVTATAHDHELLCVFAFYPTEKNDLRPSGWNIAASREELANTFPDVDPDVRLMLANCDDIKMWKLFAHEEYPYWCKGRVALMGDAAHPMMPDQNQGYSMTVEDAAALAMVFSGKYEERVGVDVAFGLEIYEKVRKERAGIVQAASLRARTDVRERFGWKSESDPPGKLSLEWLCEYDLAEHVKRVVDECCTKRYT